MDLSKLDLHPFVLLTRIEIRGKCAQVKNISTNSKQSASPIKTSVPKCYFCRKLFTRNENLNTHLRKHLQEEPYKCSTCKSRFKRNESLKNHIRTIHKHQKFKCPHCEKMYFANESLNKHIDIIHNGKVHQCHICQKPLKYKTDIKRHISTVHHKIKNHLCSFCHKGFSCFGELNRHMNSMHFLQKNLTKCPQPRCNLTFISQTAAWEHRIKFHPRDDELDKLKCKICLKIFSSYSCRRTHEKTLHGSKPPSIKCPLCANTYTTNGSLRRHITVIHTAEKSFKCDEDGCNEEFALQGKLHIHKQHHLDRKLGTKYPCEKCPRVFKHRVSMMSHKRKNHKNFE